MSLNALVCTAPILHVAAIEYSPRVGGPDTIASDTKSPSTIGNRTPWSDDVGKVRLCVALHAGNFKEKGKLIVSICGQILPWPSFWTVW